MILRVTRNCIKRVLGMITTGCKGMADSLIHLRSWTSLHILVPICMDWCTSLLTLVLATKLQYALIPLRPMTLRHIVCVQKRLRSLWVRWLQIQIRSTLSTCPYYLLHQKKTTMNTRKNNQAKISLPKGGAGALGVTKKSRGCEDSLRSRPEKGWDATQGVLPIHLHKHSVSTYVHVKRTRQKTWH